MKKKLEAELISIAHRILKLKNKSELIQLHQESQKLYEKLSVLLFVEENFTGAQPTIGRSEAYEVLETAFDENEVPGKVEMDVQEEIALEAEKAVEETPKEEETGTVETAEEIKVAEEEAETQPESEQEKVVVGEIELSDEELEEETVAAENEEEGVVEESEEEEESVTAEEEKASEETKEEVIEPAFELAFDKKEDVEEVAKESGHQIIFEDFLGSDYKDLEFVKAEIEEKHKHDHDEELAKEEVKEEIEEEVKAIEPEPEPIQEPVAEAPKPAVEKVTKGITIGLNDRVGFVNHLFGGSNEDFNRVLSQLNTFDTFQDAKNFIEDLVKPDYNEWKGKEDYAERFLEVVENKFK
ncbi:chemotaxis protein histidine kinase CheA [Flavobacterium gossypii]|uniref:Chemotaxis protein histidine kinase CheA n=1 Tax=Flavobacterium gossypii TaxID=1646119 RepID=A0ABR6DN02_9FLAO|nr:hypothetical protein [Flavobacterium gossypii]MBA9073075.1 chemotaxis protein histidine kinase CheA [Flavobacterium gossypii]